MYSGTSLVPKISYGSKLRLKIKEGESWDCRQEQEKGLRRKAYSRMFRFFGGTLLSLINCFPLSAMALGFFPLEKQDERTWNDGSVSEWICRTLTGVILLAVRAHREWWLAGVH
jgi:hypothetical protein